MSLIGTALEAELRNSLPPHLRDKNTYVSTTENQAETGEQESIVDKRSCQSNDSQVSFGDKTTYQISHHENFSTYPLKLKRHTEKDFFTRVSGRPRRRTTRGSWNHNSVRQNYQSVAAGKGRQKTIFEQTKAKLPAKVFAKWISPTEDKFVHKRGTALLDDGFMDALESPEVEINDLFFDLIFVSGVSVLNECLIAQEITLFQYITWFFINWCLWRSYTVYEAVLGENDMIHKIYGGLYGLLLACLIVAMKHADFKKASYTVGFAYLFQSGMIWRARTHICSRNEQATFGERFPILVNYLEKWSKGCVQAFVTWVCVAYFCPTDIVVACSIAIVPLHDLYFSFNIEWDKSMHPPFEYLKDRFASYIMIVLGECIVDIVNASGGATLDFNFYLVISFTFLIVIFVKFYLFDVDEFEAEEHAFLVSAIRRMVCQYSICFKGMGVALMGATLSMIFKYEVSGEPNMQTCMWYMALASTMLMTCNAIDRSIHIQRIVYFPHAIALWRFDRFFELAALIVIICQYWWWTDETPAWKPLALTFGAFAIDDLADYLPTILHEILRKEGSHSYHEELFCASELLFSWDPQPYKEDEDVTRRKSRSSMNYFSNISLEAHSLSAVEEEGEEEEEL